MKVLQTANLGKGQSNKVSDIRYEIFDTLGDSQGAASNTGIYQMGGATSGTGIYGVELNLSTQFSGSILWSVNGSTNVYATEEIKIDQKMARYIHTGRWKINESTKQMIFYEDDNTTEIAKFDLLDKSGNGSVTEIFERRRNS
tara:strand:- start:158 stop:586 length:429 start_codon:yes stop_codon:yes gene_type:complete